MINSTIALIFSYITSIQMQNSIQLNCCFISVMWINLRRTSEYRVFTNYKHDNWEKRSRRFAAITRNLQESRLLLDAPGRACIHLREDRDPDFLGNKLSYLVTFWIVFSTNNCFSSHE